MTATEQRTSGLFPHQNGRTPAQTVSCVSSNVGSITDFLFSNSHSTLPSSSPDIPSNEIHEDLPNNELQQSSSPPPQIVIHTTSEHSIDMNQQSSTTNINQTSVKNI
jgi:hypothetical protein